MRGVSESKTGSARSQESGRYLTRRRLREEQKMDDDSRTIITIETHTRTVIRRSRRVVEIVSDPIMLESHSPAEKTPSRLAARTRTLCNRLGKSLKPLKRLTNGRSKL